MKRISVLFLSLALLASLPLTGCRMLGRMMKKNNAKAAANQMKDLEKKGEVEKLKKMCEDKKTKRVACGPYVRANLKRLKDSKKCEGIEAEYQYMYYKAANRANKRRSVKWAAYNQGGILLAQCKKWDLLFTAGLYGGGTRGGGMKLLGKIEKAGVPVEAAFVTWLAKQEKPFMGQSAGGRPLVNAHIPAMQASLYFRNKRAFGHCKVFTKAAENSPTHVQSSFIEYLYHAKCEGLRGILRKRLAHSKWNIRSNACILLGKVGKREDIDKLTIVRRNDSVVRVRFKCAGAISKIKLRN